MAERKTASKSPRQRPAVATKRQAKPQIDDLERAIRSLERRLKQALNAKEALVQKHERQLANTRRAADRRVTSMMREVASLRHFEARAEAMERLLTERDGTIAALRAELAAVQGPAERSTLDSDGPSVSL